MTTSISHCEHVCHHFVWNINASHQHDAMPSPQGHRIYRHMCQLTNIIWHAIYRLKIPTTINRNANNNSYTGHLILRTSTNATCTLDAKNFAKRPTQIIDTTTSSMRPFTFASDLPSLLPTNTYVESQSCEAYCTMEKQNTFYWFSLLTSERIHLYTTIMKMCVCLNDNHYD